MINSWIIEEIKKEEKKKRERDDRPRLELPIAKEPLQKDEDVIESEDYDSNTIEM